MILITLRATKSIEPIMTRLILYLVLTTLMVGPVHGQEMLIFNSKGSVSIKTASGTIKAGYKTKVPDNATLILEEGASVSLLCSDKGKDIYTSVSFKGKASISYKEAWKQASAAVNNTEREYFKYLWSELTHPHKEVEAYHEQYMKSKGTVVRGECSSPKMLSPALGEAVSPATVAFYWEGNDGQIFRFIIFNEQGDKLLEILAQTPYVEFIIPTFWLQPERTYYWGAVPFESDDPCVRFPFKIIEQSKREALLLAIGNKYAAMDPGPENYIAHAFELEREGLYPEAIQLLGDKLEQNPQDALLRDLYGGLLTRAGRMQEAKTYFGK
jgi:hypothetical protein